MVRSTVLLFGILSLVRQTQSLCYFPDGTQAVNDKPCTDNPLATCCGQGFACLSNGLCVAVEDVKKTADQIPYFRASCTDKKWQTSHCPKFCVDPKMDRQDWAEQVSPCPNSNTAFFCNRPGGPKPDCDNNKNIFTFSGS